MIKSTTDYSIFKFITPNREIKEHHVASLVRSLSIKNLMRMYPVIVNSNMEVIDGQHRLKACEKLGIEVFYKIDNDLSEEDIPLLQNQRAWVPDDYIRHYAGLGNENYIKLRSFFEKFQVHSGKFLRNAFGGEQRQAIKNGKYKFNEETTGKYLFYDRQINELISFIRERRGSLEKTLLSINFYGALVMFLRRPDVDFDKLMNKLELKIDVIGKRIGRHGYYMMFLEIYNYKNKDPIKEVYEK